MVNNLSGLTWQGMMHMDVENNKANFILYHTEGCHLCELAANILHEAKAHFCYQDICEQNALAEKYGMYIPVVKHIKTGNTLYWPFTLHHFIDFLGANIESSSN